MNALQGVDLHLHGGVLSVVGRNGMGKTTLCHAIMGMAPVSAGSIRVGDIELTGLQPYQIAKHGVALVPQGRRVFSSLSVDEHLRLVERGHKAAWTRDRAY